MTTRFAGHLLTGTHANRPAATAVPDGTLYSCTTDDLVYQSDTSSWSTWATLGGAAGGGGYTLLEQHTASNSASLDFTTCISSTYDEYAIELVGIIPASTSDLLLRMSTNGGSSYDSGANYSFAVFVWISSTTTVSGANSGATAIGFAQTGAVAEVSTSALWGVNGNLRLFLPLSTTAYKQVCGQVAYFDETSVPKGISMIGAYQSTTAVDAFRFLMSTGNIASGTIRVYGLEK